MPKPWKSAEWREKRAKQLEGKSCEWCGSKETLAIHHKNPEQPYFIRYKIASQALLEKLIKAGVYKPINKVEAVACPECGSHSVREFRPTRYRCIDCSEYFSAVKHFKGPLSVSKEDFADFIEKNNQSIKDFLEEERQNNFEHYMTLEDTMVLCKKCHMAIGKGLILCKVCKQGYHRPNFDCCFKCFSRTERGKEVQKENELIEFKHPWCNKVFPIKQMFLEIEGNPRMCCIERCDIDSNSCDIASKNWSNDDDDYEDDEDREE